MLFVCFKWQTGDEWKDDLKRAFEELVALISDEHTVSAYELCTSGLVQALFNTLSVWHDQFCY
jgi:quinol monooxygenase YgiN